MFQMPQISSFQTFLTNLGDLVSQGSSVFLFVTGFAYVVGLSCAMIGLMKFNQYSKSPDQTPISTPILYVVCGILLIWLPTLINVTHGTMFGTGAISPLSYGGTSQTGQAMFDALISIIKFFGLVAIIKGVLLMRKVSGGQQGQDALPKAALHIIGGVILYHMLEFGQLVKGTFG